MKENSFRINRNRSLYISTIFLVILLGLGSRYYSNILPNWLADYAGDTLWALMVYLGMGLIFPKLSILYTSLISLSFSFTIEFSQLYHAHWIDSIRYTKLGGLILGFGFLWSDLICYSVGIGIGVMIKLILFRIKNLNNSGI